MIKILLPTDGSTRSLDAVRHAIHLIHCGLKARLVVANVQPPANLYEMVVAHDPGVIQKVSDAAAHDLMRPALKLIQSAGHTAEMAVGSGDPAHMLVELLENHGCTAIIVSARGTSDTEDVTPGSVAQALLDTSPVPVTLVKPTQTSVTE
ncbi:MAG: universal stress protein [Burkholderiaceae bacterium]